MVNKITDIGKNITAMISINLLVKDVAKIGQISSLIFKLPSYAKKLTEF